MNVWAWAVIGFVVFVLGVAGAAALALYILAQGWVKSDEDQ